MLYRPEDFEPLVGGKWDAERALAGIREIVADTEGALRGPKLLWPADTWDSWRATRPLKEVYAGAAGVLWALADLREQGHAEMRLDLGALALGALERQRSRPDFARWSDLPEPRESSLFSGEAGNLLVAYRLAPSPALADALQLRVLTNAENEANELLFGAPGSLVIARLMLQWTGEARWRGACDEVAAAVLASRDSDGQWTQLLFGHATRYLGPAHGLVGNVQVLLPLLDDPRRADLVRSTREILSRAAFVGEGLANWPPEQSDRLENKRGEIRLQWCHGAPGILCAAASYLDEELVLAGAGLTWAARAHRDAKGASLCHGTAGNGYALLAAFERTRDELWLERARRFAMHALAQTRRLREQRGRGRYSLFTGDLGVAAFLSACVDARSAFPLLDA
ncbi:MAG TPA: LanC-like protein [Gaiellaceae bacterium]|nr:LanC-like protein [Gaiellaceae bacterium]